MTKNVATASTICGANGVVIRHSPPPLPVNVPTLVDTIEWWAKLVERFDKIKPKAFSGSEYDTTLKDTLGTM